MEKVLEFPDALDTVLTEARQLKPSAVERISLLEAQGRVLAEELSADRDQPPFDRSTRDGFAIRAADAADPLRVAGQLRAGEHWQGPPLAPGQAIEIMTGAPLPPGADSVVMIEHILAGEGHIRLAEGRNIRPGENIVPRGAEALSGSPILSPGTLIGPAQVAVAASLGHTELSVYARPRVAIISTGDELVDLSTQPEPWQIRNSNSYGLSALALREGATPTQLGIARDTTADVGRLVDAGCRHDLLLLSGGVSMGRYDVVEQVLLERGAEFFFTGTLIQPGKPVVFGRLPNPGGGWIHIFGLPGNPVSTQVTFALFVAPLLRALCGRHDLAPVFAEATLAEEVRGGARVTRFLPAELRAAWDRVTVRPIPWQGSGDLAANARANAYVVLPTGVDRFPAGQTVRVLLR